MSMRRLFPSGLRRVQRLSEAHGSAWFFILALLISFAAWRGSSASQEPPRSAIPPPHIESIQSPTQIGEAPVDDNTMFWHVLLDQFEGRNNGPGTNFRWDGEAWAGTDYNKLWLRSEGFLHGNEKVSDGDLEVLYDRPIPFLRYFDWQIGLRYDVDSNPQRLWGAVGIEGLAPEFFGTELTLYARDAGHFAARYTGWYDILLTNRLILQPEVELNAYTKQDPGRALGSGVSNIDTGLRLRYEFSRKFGPYIGVAYAQPFGESASFTRNEGGIVHDVRLLLGVRLWY
jgi:copper resistance protein B